MNNKDLIEIKKKYGENMSHLCRTLFPSILEKEGLLLELLLEHFHPSHNLYQDLLNNNFIDAFKNYLYSFIDISQNAKMIVNKTPEELLAEAGYDLYACESEDDIQSFRKYYAYGEEICTFNELRLNKCYVFFAVKKNVWEIKRENFLNPKREDEYGTSVISIQFTRDDTHLLSIKNRYNHIVDNPDATFSNNLDNISLGLTASFENTYGLKPLKFQKGFEIPNYVLARDGKYYKYNYEINNIYYCPDNIVIDNFKVKKYAKEKYLVMDYFLLDLVNKKIFLLDKNIEDSFIDSIGKIEKIQIENNKDTKKVIISPVGGSDIQILLDKENNIIGLFNKNILEVRDCFLIYNKKLMSLDFPNVKEIKDYFLYNNISLKKLFLPSLKQIGNYFLFRNKDLLVLILQSLEQVGNYFLTSNENLTIVFFPNLKQIGNDFLYCNISLTRAFFPKLEIVGSNFLHYNESLLSFYFPNIKIKGTNFLSRVVKQKYCLENESNFSKVKKRR